MLFLFGCGEHPIMEKSFELPFEGWSYDNSFDFPIDIENKDAKYRLEMFVQHSNEYDFQNLYTRIKTEFPNGNTATDTVSIQLSDKYGRWFGKCSSGKCAYRVVLKDSFNFIEAGMHNVHLEQYSRTGYLEGIQELGFALYQY